VIVLELNRTYYYGFTTCEFTLNGVHLCFSLELPWRDNQRNISSIPDGFYPIRFRQSAKYKKHLHIQDVENRKWTLIHPANDAKKELRGCIAPVMKTENEGKGQYSRIALDLILINLNKNTDNKMYLRILSKS